MAGEAKTSIENVLSEFGKFIKNVGYDKAIFHLTSINKSKHGIETPETYKLYQDSLIDCEICEFVIKSTTKVFQISETVLYTSQEKFRATPARRTAYVLIQKYCKYTDGKIATKFKKSRPTVTSAILQYKKMEAEVDKRFYKDYLVLHDAVEKEVLEFAEESRKVKTVKTKEKKENN